MGVVRAVVHLHRQHGDGGRLSLRLSPSTGVMALTALLVTACASGTPAPSATVTPTPTVVPTTGTPTPAPTVGAPGPAVLAAVAAATPTGTVVFVLVRNDATPRTAVTVTATANSSNGRAAVSGRAAIAVLAAGEVEATTVRVAVPSGDEIASVAAEVQGVAAASPPPADPLTVSGATFSDDPVSPAVGVTVAATTTTRAAVVAVCYQGTTVVGGGVLVSEVIHAPGPQLVRLQAALTAAPTSCQGYAYPD